MKFRKRVRGAVDAFIDRRRQSHIERLVRANGSWFPGDGGPGQLRTPFTVFGHLGHDRPAHMDGHDALAQDIAAGRDWGSELDATRRGRR